MNANTIATQYRIVTAEEPIDLARQVNYFFAQGWKLQGGVSVAITYIPESEGRDIYPVFRYEFAQAMILENEQS